MNRSSGRGANMPGHQAPETHEMPGRPENPKTPVAKAPAEAGQVLRAVLAIFALLVLLLSLLALGAYSYRDPLLGYGLNRYVLPAAGLQVSEVQGLALRYSAGGPAASIERLTLTAPPARQDPPRPPPAGPDHGASAPDTPTPESILETVTGALQRMPLRGLRISTLTLSPEVLERFALAGPLEFRDVDLTHSRADGAAKGRISLDFSNRERRAELDLRWPASGLAGNPERGELALELILRPERGAGGGEPFLSLEALLSESENGELRQTAAASLSLSPLLTLVSEFGLTAESGLGLHGLEGELSLSQSALLPAAPDHPLPRHFRLTVRPDSWLSIPAGDPPTAADQPEARPLRLDFSFPLTLQGMPALRQDQLSLEASLYRGEEDEPPEEAGLLAGVTLQHDLESRSGSAELQGISLSFGPGERSLYSRLQALAGRRPEALLSRLSDSPPPLWPPAFDLVAGEVRASAELAWQREGESLALTGPISLDVLELSGYYDQVAFVRASTTLRAELTPGPGLLIPPGTPAVIESVDPGFPLRSLDFRYGFDSRGPAATLRNFRASVFGGTLRVDELVLTGEQEAYSATLEVERIDLEQVLSLAEYEGVQATGLISGTLPLRLADGDLTVSGGRLYAEEPGGRIHYQLDSDAGEGSRLETVNRALSNFHYQLLESTVNYKEDGELLLDVRLEGSNPELDRQVNVNLSISDDIPALLQSLQSGRAVTEAIERQLSQPGQNEQP